MIIDEAGPDQKNDNKGGAKGKSGNGNNQGVIKDGKQGGGSLWR